MIASLNQQRLDCLCLLTGTVCGKIADFSLLNISQESSSRGCTVVILCCPQLMSATFSAEIWQLPNENKK